MGSFAANVWQETVNEKNEQKKSRLAPLSQALQADQTRLAVYADPDDPTKAAKGKEKEYESTISRMEKTIGQMREIMGVPRPKEGLLDRLHIRRDLAGRVAKYGAETKGMAQQYAQGVVPYGMTPESQAAEQKHRQTMEEIAARTKPTYKEYVSPDGKQRQWFPIGEAPEGWQAQQGSTTMKPIKGTLVKSKQSPTGWAQTWVNPNNPNQIVGWQPVQPSRYYQGTITTGSTTDPFGMTTTTSRTTQPLPTQEVDLSNVTKLPEEEAAPTTSGETPTEKTTTSPSAKTPAAKKVVPKAPFGPKTKALQEARKGAGETAQLDESGHIPANAANPYVVQAANQLLDGMDVNKLPIPPKAREAASALASKYGWGGQGMWTPREKMQVEQSRQLITSMSGDPSMMDVFNEGPFKRGLMAQAIKASPEKGWSSGIMATLANQGLNDREIRFVQSMRNLIGRIQGLAQLTRGSGRPTEQAVNRMIMEIPDVSLVRNPEEARHAFQLIEDEMSIAMPKRGKSPSGKGRNEPKTQQKVMKYNPSTGRLE